MSGARALADAISRIAFRYDAVVVGSGYGGAIAAARLAEKGLAVCVLERGREWHPGDFPTDETSLAKVVRSPLNPLGLIDPNTQLANDIDVVVGCGLGGTSLLNAAIALRPESAVFDQPEWPKRITQAWHDGTLADCYARAEQMLGVRRHEPLATLAKVRAHRAAVEARGVISNTLPLAIAREPAARHGVEQPACVHCGDCVAGCNAGAKNTLATNYLPFAKRHGARIFTACEVLRVVPEDGGFRVDFLIHKGDGGVLDSKIHASVRAGVVVLGAGSMGSTEILLRSQTEHVRFSPRLGGRFSANADILGFGYNGDRRTDVIGHGARGGEREGWPVGSTITSYGDYRRGEPGSMLDRFLLLEGAIPSPLVKTVARAIGTWSLSRVTTMGSAQRERVLADLAPLAPPGPDGALNHSTLYLACGHDTGSGRLVLEGSECRVTIAWPGIEREAVFATITREMEELARSQNAIFIPNPRSTVLGGERQMTVHPLGGCPMGDDGDRGAVDDRGRVFRDDGGVHRGLYVADGAVIPRSLGVTPLLTISALAERIADGILSDLGTQEGLA
jgi:cholesterol oxidase